MPLFTIPSTRMSSLIDNNHSHHHKAIMNFLPPHSVQQPTDHGSNNRTCQTWWLCVCSCWPWQPWCFEVTQTQVGFTKFYDMLYGITDPSMANHMLHDDVCNGADQSVFHYTLWYVMQWQRFKRVSLHVMICYVVPQTQTWFTICHVILQAVNNNWTNAHTSWCHDKCTHLSWVMLDA